jgi:hypothetical protein
MQEINEIIFPMAEEAVIVKNYEEAEELFITVSLS